MNDALPAPFTSSEMDIRDDLDGFMLNVERLLASELWALTKSQPLAFRGAVGLWARAWKQIPPASLPNDETVIAAFADMTLAQFRKLRALVMRGFELCSDGRYYHRRLAEEVCRIWRSRLSDSRRAELRSAAWRQLRIQVFERDGYACQYCGSSVGMMHCDHIHPVIRGGATEIDNLITACVSCNCSKGGRTLDEWSGAH